MASSPESKETIQTAAASIQGVVRRYPAAIALAFIILAAALTVIRSNADRVTYENSPEGKAEAAQAMEAAKDTIDLNLAREFVQTRLRDPDSAKFTDVRVVRRDGVKGVCGYVNSRNGLGGMAGNEAFAVIKSNTIMASDAYAKDMRQLEHLCYGQ